MITVTFKTDKTPKHPKMQSAPGGRDGGVSMTANAHLPGAWSGPAAQPAGGQGAPAQ